MALYQRGATWWYSFTVDGQRIQESAHTNNKRLAKTRMEAHSTNLRNGLVGLHPKLETEQRPVSRLLDALEEDWRQDGKLSAPNRSNLKRARQAFGHYVVDELAADDVKHYITQRLHDGAQSASVNRVTQILGRAYRLAELDPPRIKHLKEDNRRKGFLARGDFDRLQQQLPADLRDFALFGYLTGMRKSEIASQRWKFEHEKGIIELQHEDAKTDEARKIVMSGELAALLERRRTARSYVNTHGVAAFSEFIFHRGGEPVREFRKSWASACKAAGLPGTLFHDFRRSAIRNLIRARVPEKVCMDISGHRTRSVFDRYNISDTTDIENAFEKLAGTPAVPSNITAIR
jgi:integrase